MENKVRNYMNKYHTPRIFQILITAAMITMAGCMLLLGLVYPYHYDIKWTENIVYVISCKTDISISLLGCCVIISAMAGCAFIWLNRPIKTAICAGILTLFNIGTMLAIEKEHSYDMSINIDKIGKGTQWRDPIYWDVDFAKYMFLWFVLTILIVVVVLGIITTKKGARPQKREYIVPIPTSSSADELIKFKQLLDSGAITQEEFENKKREIIRE